MSKTWKRTIKYDTVKRRAIKEFLELAEKEKSAPDIKAFSAFMKNRMVLNDNLPFNSLDEWTKYGVSLIDYWDIRHAMGLVEIFPSCLPKELHDRRPVAAHNEKGQWILVFD